MKIPLRKWQAALLMVLGAVMFFSFTALGETAVSQSRELTLSEALDLGVKNNAQISLASLSAEASRINLSQAQKAAKDMQETIDDSPVHIPVNQEVYPVLYIYPLQAQYADDLAQKTLAYTENSIKYGIETAYYGLQVANKAMEVAHLDKERNATQLNNVKAKEQQGVASKIDLYSAQSAYLSSEAAYAESKDSVSYAAMKLNQLLGQDINTPLVLKDALSLIKGDPVNADQAYAEAMASDLAYLQKENTYENVVLTSDFQQQFSSANTYQYKKAEVNRRQAQISYSDAKTALEIKVRYAYNNLNTALLNYNSLTQSRALAAEAYRLAQLRYQAGLATIYDVQNANTALNQAEMGLLNAIRGYNLSMSAFRYGIFPDPENYGS